MDLTDAELVNKCLNGDNDAFSELVTRYKKLVYSVIYNMVSDKQEINDIAQEVFLRIYKSLQRYNPEFKFSTWTVKIATNLCLDLHRKKRPDSVPIDEIECMVKSSDTPEEMYLQTEQSRMIREAINELPEKYKLPIVLFHQNQMSYEEMKDIMDEPMSIVKNRLYRARLMLREKLMQGRKEEIL